MKTLVTDIDSIDIDKITLLDMLDGNVEFDPTFIDSDFAKTQEDRKQGELDEYEAFNRMHDNDGTHNKCVCNL